MLRRDSRRSGFRNALGPALSEMGVVPIAAHLFLFYFGMMSMVTPPVALATFAAASIAQADLWRSGWTGVRLGIVAYVVPFVMVYQPGLVLEGSGVEIAGTIIKSLIGVMVLSWGAVGFLFGPPGPVVRLFLVASGAATMLTPLAADTANLSVLAASIVAGTAAMVANYVRRPATS